MSLTIDEVKATISSKLSAKKAELKAWILAKSDDHPWVVVGYSAVAGLIIGIAAKQLIN